MNAGLIAFWDVLEWSLSNHCSISNSEPVTTSGVSGSATLFGYGSPNYSASDFGIHISVLQTKQSSDDPGTTTGTIILQDLSISVSGTTSGLAPATVALQFNGLKVYCTSGGWTISWTTITGQFNGTSILSHGAGSLSSIRLAPTGIPLFGVPPTLSGGGGCSVHPASGIPPVSDDNSSTTQSVSGTATGGWHFKPHGGSGFIALPVNVNVASPGGIGVPSPSAGDTFSGSCSYAYNISLVNTSTGAGGYMTTATQNNGENCSVMLLPNFTKSVIRLNSDYGAMVYRGAIPYARRGMTHSETYYTPADPTGDNTTATSNYDYPFVHEVPFLAHVTSATHPLEEVFSRPSYALYSSHNGTESGNNTSTPHTGYDTIKTADSLFFDQMDTITSQMVGVLSHPDPVSNYVDYCCNPHWSMFLWAPQDGSSGSSAWPMYGAPVDPSAYWLPLREQYFSNPSLPPGENSLTRNSIVSEPLLSGGLTGLQQPNANFWGISRFKVLSSTVVPSVTLDASSSPLWSSSGCTLSFGTSSITVTPVGGTPGTPLTVTATFKLASFTSPPFMYGHLADNFNLSLSASNVTSIAVAMNDPFGGSLTIVGSSGNYKRPTGQSAKYAGSWGVDKGVGFVADRGTDVVAGSGVSVAEYANPETVYCQKMFEGRGGDSITFTITLTDGTLPATIQYPVLHAPSSNAGIFTEDGQSQIIIFPSSVGLRFGQWKFGVSGANTPTAYPPGLPSAIPAGWKSSIIDGYAWNNCVLNGVAASTGSSTWASNWDSVEATTLADLNSNSISFLLPTGQMGAVALVNGLAEVPPMCVFPSPMRDINFAPSSTGTASDYGQSSYSLITEPRYIIAPATVQLTDPSGTLWTSETSTISGWSIAKHNHPVTNSEGDTFHVLSSGTVYGYVSPWHGYFCELNFASGVQSPRLEEAPNGKLHVLTVVNPNQVRYQVSPFSVPPFATDNIIFETTDPAVIGIHARHCMTSFLRAYVAISQMKTSSCVSSLIYSDDDGKTFIFDTSFIMTNLYLVDIRSSQSGITLCIGFKPDTDPTSGAPLGPGTFQAQIKNPGDASFGAIYTLTDGTNPLKSDGNGFGFDCARESSERWLLTFTIPGDAQPSIWASADDALTFQRL